MLGPRISFSPGWLIVAACAVEILSMASFAAFPVLIPVLQPLWRLSNSEAGWISGIYFGGYVIAVAVLTALTDRVDPKRVYLASMALSVIAAGAMAFAAHGLVSASFWRLAQGIGLAGTYMPGLRILSDQLPAHRQSRGTAFYTSSFSVGAGLSYFIAGTALDFVDWPWVFAVSAVGPAIALAGAAWVFRSRPAAGHEAPPSHLLDFRPVLRNARALGFTLAYAVHNAELFAYRSWIVAFLVFAHAQQPAGAFGLGWSITTIAAVIALLAMPSSVLFNELAARVGRQPVAIGVMLASAAVGAAIGFLADAPYGLLLAVAVLYGITITGESSTLTAGVVQAAEPRYKGATMAMHSVIGFVGSFLGPLAFGVVLDLAGGEALVRAWGVGFLAMSAILLAGPLAIARLVGLKPLIR